MREPPETRSTPAPSDGASATGLLFPLFGLALLYGVMALVDSLPPS